MKLTSPLARWSLFVVPTLLASGAPLLAQETEEAEPEPERGLRLNEPNALPGYTMFAPLRAKAVQLVDMQGELVHTWETTYPPGSVYLLNDGHLLLCARIEDNPRFRGGGIGGCIQKLDWDGNVVWEYILANEDQTQHHDVEPMPNGNVLIITWEARFREDAVAWGRDPEAVGEEGIWPDAVLELKPVGKDDAEVVWEWHSWDHLIQDFDAGQENFGSIPDHPELVDINVDHRDQPPITEAERKKRADLEKRMRALGYVGGKEEDDDAPDGNTSRGRDSDWLHTNSIDYHAGFDLIVLSVPTLGEIWVIDHSTTPDEAAWHSGGRWGKGGDLLYRWGNPRTYGEGDDDDKQLFYQHHPEFIAGETSDELRILVFNNGQSRPGDTDYSSVEELLLPFTPAAGFTRKKGKAFGPKEPTWSYSDPGTFYSSFISGTQRLSNGNTLICSGAPGRIFEVTRAGEIVWEYLNPYVGEVTDGGGGGNAPPTALFRATRIPTGHPGLRGRL